MLELHCINSPKRLQSIRITKQKGLCIHSQSDQFRLADKMMNIEHTTPLQLKHAPSGKKKKNTNVATSTFNVCQSKNVFVFTRKTSKSKECRNTMPFTDRK